MGKFPENPLRHELLQCADYLEDTTVQGSLYLIENYPGYIPHGSGEVHGELWNVHLPDRLFPLLDVYEDVNIRHQELGEYRRELMWVNTKNRGLVKAWIYIYQGPVNSKKKLNSGQFR